jgi:thiamine pyrophosphokinase
MPAEEGVSEEVVVVVSGGEPPDSRTALAVSVLAGTPVVAADRGLEHALALGLEVTVAIGDFDSASPESVAVAEAAGVRIERHPHEKDATDLELALDAAADMSPSRILVIGSGGGRLDHALSTLLLLGAERYAGVQIDARIDEAQVHVIRGDRVLDGVPGELVSLLALHGPAEGVTTEGLAYPLREEMLEAGSSRGVSNSFVAETARISLLRGVLLAIRPGEAP